MNRRIALLVQGKLPVVGDADAADAEADAEADGAADADGAVAA